MSKVGMLLLLVAGYLKTPNKKLKADGACMCEVCIPNRDIAAVAYMLEKNRKLEQEIVSFYEMSSQLPCLGV